MNTIKYALKKEWHNLILLILPFLAIPFVWDQLPAQIPTHWNLQGHVDDYSSKESGMLFIPVLAIFLYLILLYLPKIDPKKRIEIDQKPIPTLRTLVVILLLSVHTWMLAMGMGLELDAVNWLNPGIALSFVVIGNYLRTIKPNYFIGIRLPWTLEDEGNWRETHRLASCVWVTGGLLLLLLFPFLDNSTYSTIIGITVALLVTVPAVYSFYLYKQSDEHSRVA